MTSENSTTRGLAEAWVERLAEGRLLMAARDAVESELSGWIERLEDGSHGELMREVALHGRQLGAEGRPASAALMQIAILDDLLAERAAAPELRAVAREMLRVVADAHALGAGARQAASARRRLAHAAPVIGLPGGGVLGLLVASMEAEVIDALVARLLQAAAGRGAERILLDVSGAPADDDTFHRTLLGYANSADFADRPLEVTGLEDPDRTAAALAALGVPGHRVRLFARLEDAL